MTMPGADFLFPKDLRVSDSGIKNVLVLGSCAAGSFAGAMKWLAKHVRFDSINIGSGLPETPPLPIGDYNFQFVQLPLREIVTDRVVFFKQYMDEKSREEIFENARHSLRFRLEAAMRYNKESGILTFVSNFPVPQVPVAASLDRVGGEEDFRSLVLRLNEQLCDLIREYKNTFFCDYDMLTGANGKRFFYDDSVAFYSHFFLLHKDFTEADTKPVYNAPPEGRIDPLPPLDQLYELQTNQTLQALWDYWESLYRTVNQIDSVKLVIFDLDDTMWRGQIAEHYGEGAKWPVIIGWPMGVWEAVHHLRARGILTAICSKNEVSVVEARWDRAISGKWLSLDDFTFREINWRPKAENIAKIIKQASLTPKSVVFVDDNPVERASVAAALPGIRVIGSNPYETRRILLWSSETQVARLSKESMNRDGMIRKQQLREAERESMSREEFLKGLNCSVRLNRTSSTSSPDFTRCFELLNKTNQFNTTGKRWLESQLAAFFAASGCLYSFVVEDKFTQYGLVGVILYRAGEFEQFAMSCRVLGLGVEESVLNEIIRREEAGGHTDGFSAKVVETEANIVCRDVYIRAGFNRDLFDPLSFTRQSGIEPKIAEHLQLQYEEA